ncbi:hypothetical protein HID58_070012, partial [Brassica napus]
QLSREEKGKDIATSPSLTRDVTANGSPLDEFDLIHRDALRDTENIFADAHRQIREEGADRVEVGSSDMSGSGQNIMVSVLSLCLVLLVAVDWESRLPCFLGPHKSRLSLFTRKQKKLLKKAREMEGVPDLSALLKGKLQLLSRKTTSDVVPESTNSEEAGASKGRDSIIVDEDISAEPSALSPKNKKKSKNSKKRVTDEAPGADVPLGEAASLGEASKSSKAKKKKEGKKRPREGTTSPVDHDDMLREGREATPEDLVGADPIEAVPEDRPKNKTKKRSVEAVPRATADGNTPSLSPETPLEKRRKLAASEGGSRSESAASERSAPDSATRRGVRSEGSLTRRGGGGANFHTVISFLTTRRLRLFLTPFDARSCRARSVIGYLYFKDEYVDAAFTRPRFSYDEKTPFIFNPLRYAELARQIRGGTRELP